MGPLKVNESCHDQHPGICPNYCTNENNINNFWAFRNATTIDNANVDNEKLSCWWTLFPTNPLKCRVGQLFSGAGKFLHPLLLPSQHTFPSKIFTLGDNNHCL